MRKTTILLALLLAGGGVVNAQNNELKSYIRNYAGDWWPDDVIQLSTGDNFALGPQGPNGDMGGQWTWTGPNNFQSNNREIAFNNVTVDQAGIYTVTQKANNGAVYTHEVKVYVDSKLSKNDVLRTYDKNDKADLMYNAFNDAFLYTNPNSHRTYYKYGYNNTNNLYSWEQGLNLLMLMDRYRFRGDETMIPTISKTVDALNGNENGNSPSGRNVENGNGIVPRDINNKYSDRAKAEKLSNWTWNEYNDDLLWLSLPNIRAYQITGEKRFLNQAIWTWDYMDERGWDGEMGGGYWWCVFPKKEKDQCKSGLSNNPAICLSAYLYEATGDEKYLNRAKEIFEWVYAVLRDKDGKISENINIVNSDVPTKSGGYNVYNQGPFIEGAAALYRITGDERYFNAAKETMDWTILNRVNNDGIMEYGNKTDGTWQSEFMRGMAFLLETRPELWKATTSTKGHNQITYYDWLRMNADAAYNTRETVHNLSDCAWDKPTTFLPDNNHSEMWVGSVIAEQVVPATNPWQGNNFNAYKVDIPTPETLAQATGYVKDQYGWWKATRLGVDPGESVALRVETAISGTWKWTGPEGALASTTNEISFANFTADMSGAYIATCTAGNGTRAQVTFYVNVITTQKATIVPYVIANNGWQQINTLDVAAGNNFSMGPQVKDTPNANDATWSWAGPGNFTSQDRQVNFNNVSSAQAGIYTATVTDMFGQHVQEEFTILVDGVLNAVPQSVSVSMSIYKQVTYSSDYDLDFSNSNLNAYVASGYNSLTGSILLSRVYEVPAGTGLLLKGDAGTYDIPLLDHSRWFYRNMFKAVVKSSPVPATEDGYVNYCLAGNGANAVSFYRIEDSMTLADNRAYLQVPASMFGSNGARNVINLQFDDETTGISDVKSATQDDARCFDLQGRRVDAVKKGFYIKNGHKFIR